MRFWCEHIRQFFEGDAGGLSMTRLLCFLSFFPASWVTVKLCNENALAIFVGTYALSYLGKEGIAAVKDIKASIKETTDVPAK